MSKRAPSLSVAQLMEVFGVSHVTIYNWGKNLGFPELGDRTAGEIKRWAKKQGKLMVREPLDVVLGRRSKKADRAIKRTATGRMSSARAAR